jgi:hypothetical protein
MFMLEHKEPYIVKTELTKNRTCQSYRWKQVAMCESPEPLIDWKRKNETPGYQLRVIDYSNLKVVG